MGIDNAKTGRTVIRVLLSVLTAFGCLAVNAELYSWIDENGHIHYSDRVPVSDVRQERKVFTQKGRYLETIPAAKTKEQREREAREALIKAREQEEKARRRAHDRMLMATFSSVDELERARNDRLAIVNTAMAILEGKLAELHTKLDQLQARVADAEKRGQDPAQRITTGLRQTRQRLQATQSQLEAKLKEKEEIEVRFAKDIERFSELQAERRY